MTTVYFAGGLFSHKDLFGNKLLKAAIEKISDYKIVLPQDLEQNQSREKGIRDSDLSNVINCDCAIFNYDGTELDSGTVVEFMVANIFQKPSLILRTDFRSGGDGLDADAYPWNLMCSFYKNTDVLISNAMVDYKTANGDFDQYYTTLATKIVEKMDNLFNNIIEKSDMDMDLLLKHVEHTFNFKKID